MNISVPSYVVPGSYLENLRFLKANSRIRRVELLFFMYDDETRALIGPEWPEIRQMADSADPDAFRFTLHLPDVLCAEHRSLIELSCGFVDAYVVHPPRDLSTTDGFAEMLVGWQNEFRPSFRLENTCQVNFDAAFQALHSARLEQNMTDPLPVCADIGHLLLEGYDPLTWLDNCTRKIEEIHLHGCSNGRDHIPFTGQESWFNRIRPWLSSFDGLVELEMFAWQDLKPIISILEGL